MKLQSGDQRSCGNNPMRDDNGVNEGHRNLLEE